MSEITALHAANAFIRLAAREGNTSLTLLKLIKLCYIFYAWYLVVKEKRPFRERPQAWQYGPVFPSVYHAFCNHGKTPLTDVYKSYDFDNETFKTPDLDRENLILARHVWENYKDCKGFALSEITHAKESAWDKAYNKGEGYGELLEDDLIKPRAEKAIKEYIKKLPPPNS